MIHFEEGYEAEKQKTLPANMAAPVKYVVGAEVETSRSCFCSIAISLVYCSGVKEGAECSGLE